MPVHDELGKRMKENYEQIAQTKLMRRTPVAIRIDGKAFHTFTRDTFSSCIKATYCEINGKPYPIFKNPKDGGFKKSQKGCCIVYEDEWGLHYEDGYTWKEASICEENLLQPVFYNGKMVKQYTRNNLHGGKF